MAQNATPKCFRKVALCHIEQREFARATTVIRRCPGGQASTHYILFLASAYQGARISSLAFRAPFRVHFYSGLEDEGGDHMILIARHSIVYLSPEQTAIRAVEDMVKAPDFDRKMLLLATSLAHEADMKSLLLAVLEALLTTLKMQGAVDAENEAVVLIRCIIRLVLGLVKQPGADQ